MAVAAALSVLGLIAWLALCFVGAALWLLALVIRRGFPVLAMVAQGYLGGSVGRLLGLAVLTLAVAPLGVWLAFYVGMRELT